MSSPNKIKLAYITDNNGNIVYYGEAHDYGLYYDIDYRYTFNKSGKAYGVTTIDTTTNKWRMFICDEQQEKFFRKLVEQRTKKRLTNS